MEKEMEEMKKKLEETEKHLEKVLWELREIHHLLKEQNMEIWWNAMIVFKRREDYNRVVEQLKTGGFPKFGIWEADGLCLGDSAALYLSSPDGCQSFVKETVEAIKKEYSNVIEEIKFGPVLRESAFQYLVERLKKVT
jgi:hypothetical protein